MTPSVLPLLLLAVPPRLHDNARRADRRDFVERLLHGSPDAGTCDVVSGQCFWWTGASSTDRSALPNDGVLATIQAVDAPPDGGCFDCWTSDLLDNGFWGQVGFSSCDPSVYPGAAFTTFYQVWNTDAGLLLVDGESTWASTGLHEFAMGLDAGTTWTYSVDGTAFGAWDMGAAATHTPYAVAVLCEQGDGVTAPADPPSISMPVTMDVSSLGVWAPAGTAWAYDTTGFVGVAGNLQQTTLADGETAVGGAMAYTPMGTPLWNGSSGDVSADAGAPPLTPPLVEILAPAPNETVRGSVTVDARVIAPAGVTVTEVDVWLDNPSQPSCRLTAAPWVCPWNTALDAPGIYYPTVTATDGSGNSTWVDIPVNVAAAGGSSAGGPSTGGATGAGSNTSGRSSSSGTRGGSSGGVAGSGSGASSAGTGSGTNGMSSTGAGDSTAASGSTGGERSGGGSRGGSSTATAGPFTSSSAATAGSTGSSVRPVPPPAQGCGCAAGRSSPAGPGLLLLAVALLRRRRDGGSP